MRVAQKTDTGVDKLRNEDSVLTCGFDFPCPEGRERYDLLIVADGVGGEVAGDIASREAVTVVANTVFASLSASYREPGGDVGPDAAWALYEAFQIANTRVWSIAQANPGFEGMASTMVAALVHGGYIDVAHLGDCRAYRRRGPVLEQLTKDHSLVQWMVDMGDITPAEAFRHEHNNVVSRGIGFSQTAILEMHTHELLPRDTLILATDGAVKDLPIAALVGLVRSLPREPAEPDLARFCESVVDAAKDPAVGASLDNITILAAYADEPVPCVQTHARRTVPYGTRMPAENDKRLLRHFGQTLPYGVALPSYRLQGTAGPAYCVE